MSQSNRSVTPSSWIFALVLLVLRESAGISEEDVMSKTGLTRDEVRNIESGGRWKDISYDRQIRGYCSALQIRMSSIMQLIEGIEKEGVLQPRFQAGSESQLAYTPTDYQHVKAYITKNMPHFLAEM